MRGGSGTSTRCDLASRMKVGPSGFDSMKPITGELFEGNFTTLHDQWVWKLTGDHN